MVACVIEGVVYLEVNSRFSDSLKRNRVPEKNEIRSWMNFGTVICPTSF